MVDRAQAETFGFSRLRPSHHHASYDRVKVIERSLGIVLEQPPTRKIAERLRQQSRRIPKGLRVEPGGDIQLVLLPLPGGRTRFLLEEPLPIPSASGVFPFLRRRDLGRKMRIEGL